jgi:Carboxypeptidase regulatory-like domain/TonB-dependent Receptor Plug Domain/TonB dependent receptor-like, beta-barrel
MMTSKLRNAALSLLFACPGLLHAQFESGTVLGTIHDQTGGVVAKCSVTLENVQTGVTASTSTSSQGDYLFVNVRLGRYRVKAEAPGFQSAVTDSFELTTNSRQRVDLSLQVGQVSESVQVTGAAAVLETDSSSRGQVINPQQIVDLPLNGRAYADLALLVPGVRKSMLENQTETSRDASFNVNGLRSSLNNFMLDGVDNNAYGTSNQGFSNQVVQASPDALQEFKVETNNFSAEYGRSGGAIINASIKSGTNGLHGDIWEFLRNTDLNAVGFFQPTGGVKPVFNQNQFGAAAGGRIRKDKTFFFGDYEGLRRVSRSLMFATVPTLDMRAGNFGIPVKNPITGTVYSNGVVPASDQIAFAKTVLSQVPAPNLPGIANNFESLPRTTINDNKGDIRVDQYFGQKLAAFARFSIHNADIFAPGNIPPPAGGNGNGNVYVKNWQVVPGATWTINANSVLEMRVGFHYTEGGKNPIGLGLPTDIYGIPNLPTNPAFTGGLYTLNFTGGLSQLGRQNSNPQYQDPFVVDPKVNYSRSMGRHSLKMGYEFQAINTEIQDFHPKYGQDNYTGLFSNPGTGTLSSLQQQVFSVADFMFGARNHYELNNYAVDQYRQRMHFAYIQDDFKASSRLTLNLGLRYEFATPQWEDSNRLGNFDPATQTLIQAKAGSIYDRALVHPRYKDFAPRVGLAYRVLNHTVLRSAFGISYIHFNRLGGENLLGYNGPNIVDAAIDQLPTQPLCTANAAPITCFRPTYMGYPDNFASPSAFNTLTSQVRYIPADNRDAYVQNWHFTVQQQLATNLTLDVAYVGNRSVGLMILGDFNQAAVNQPGQNLTLAARRPYQKFTTIEVAFDGGFATYHALQFKLEKRYSAGLYLLNSFAWSKGMDNASGHLEVQNGDNSRANIRDLPHEKGLSSYDQPFNNTTSIVYELPFGKGKRYSIDNKLENYILGGWQVNLINTLTSGLPINLTYSPSSQFQTSTLISYRPNLVGPPVTPEGQRTVNNYLNPASVVAPTDPSQPYGNAGRNIARGYPFYELDCGLHKDFRMWSESSRLEFRAEAFNLLNQTNFMAPASTIGSTYGRITSTFPARQFQFGLKLVF